MLDTVGGRLPKYTIIYMNLCEALTTINGKWQHSLIA